jgi:ABC-type transporter Mla MlaB component
MPTIVVDASHVAADLRSVDALASLQLAAKRLGGAVVLQGASDDLRRLIALAGLEQVLAVES